MVSTKIEIDLWIGWVTNFQELHSQQEDRQHLDSIIYFASFKFRIRRLSPHSHITLCMWCENFCIHRFELKSSIFSAIVQNTNSHNNIHFEGCLCAIFISFTYPIWLKVFFSKNHPRSNINMIYDVEKSKRINQDYYFVLFLCATQPFFPCFLLSLGNLLFP